MRKTIVPEHYTFLYCICRQYKITTRNFLMQKIMEDVKTQRRIIPSLSKLGCDPQEPNSRKVHPHLTDNERDRNCNEVWKEKHKFI